MFDDPDIGHIYDGMCHNIRFGNTIGIGYVRPPRKHASGIHRYKNNRRYPAAGPIRKSGEALSEAAGKSSGLGIHNLVMEALFETNRFRYVEEKPEITEDIIDRQWLSASGFFSNSQAVSYGEMLGAEKVVYGEIYDYAEGGGAGIWVQWAPGI